MIIVLPFAYLGVMSSPTGQQRTAMLVVAGIVLAIGVTLLALLPHKDSN